MTEEELAEVGRRFVDGECGNEEAGALLAHIDALEADVERLHQQGEVHHGVALDMERQRDKFRAELERERNASMEYEKELKTSLTRAEGEADVLSNAPPTPGTPCDCPGTPGAHEAGAACVADECEPCGGAGFVIGGGQRALAGAVEDCGACGGTGQKRNGAPPVFTLEEVEKAMRLAAVGEDRVDPALVITMLASLRSTGGGR